MPKLSPLSTVPKGGIKRHAVSSLFEEAEKITHTSVSTKFLELKCQLHKNVFERMPFRKLYENITFLLLLNSGCLLSVRFYVSLLVCFVFVVIVCIVVVVCSLRLLCHSVSPSLLLCSSHLMMSGCVVVLVAANLPLSL